MSSETAPVSEPVYDYQDNTYGVKRLRMHSRTLCECYILADLGRQDFW